MRNRQIRMAAIAAGFAVLFFSGVIFLRVVTFLLGLRCPANA